MIHISCTKKPTMQQWCSFVDTKSVDFSKSQSRDEVSFYRKLARINKATELGIDLEEYTKLLRLSKSGKQGRQYNITYNKKVANN